MKVVVRKWEEFDAEWEFRCFIVNNEIMACSQYYTLCYISDLVHNKTRVQKFIKDWFESIRDLIPISNYTIDFAIAKDLSKAWVIEINHPPPTAGV